jgi:hypothetical protein
MASAMSVSSSITSTRRRVSGAVAGALEVALGSLIMTRLLPLRRGCSGAALRLVQEG